MFWFRQSEPLRSSSSGSRISQRRGRQPSTSANFLPKTAWKWKKIWNGEGRGVRPWCWPWIRQCMTWVVSYCHGCHCHHRHSQYIRLVRRSRNLKSFGMSIFASDDKCKNYMFNFLFQVQNIRQWKFHQVARWAPRCEGEQMKDLVPSWPFALLPFCPPTLASLHSPTLALFHPPTLMSLAPSGPCALLPNFQSAWTIRIISVCSIQLWGTRVWGCKGERVQYSHLSKVCIWIWTSFDIPGQYTWSCCNNNTLSIPIWPISSWHGRTIFFLSGLGNNSWWSNCTRNNHTLE